MQLKTKVRVGDKAPDFSLPDTDSKMRSLSEFLGQKVVLAFFVTAFTTTCTMEACKFRDSMSRIIDLEAQVIGISVNDESSNREFADRNHLPFPVLTDHNAEAVKAYGLTPEDAVGPDGYEFVKRSVFIIDKAGIIRYVWVADSASGEPKYDEIQKVLQKI
jgi:peroxiredoxin